MRDRVLVNVAGNPEPEWATSQPGPEVRVGQVFLTCVPENGRQIRVNLLHLSLNLRPWAQPVFGQETPVGLLLVRRGGRLLAAQGARPPEPMRVLPEVHMGNNIAR